MVLRLRPSGGGRDCVIDGVHRVISGEYRAIDESTECSMRSARKASSMVESAFSTSTWRKAWRTRPGSGRAEVTEQSQRQSIHTTMNGHNSRLALT